MARRVGRVDAEDLDPAGEEAQLLEREAHRGILSTRVSWRSLAPALGAAVVVVVMVAGLAIWRPDMMQPAPGEYSELFVESLCNQVCFVLIKRAVWFVFNGIDPLTSNNCSIS